MRYPRLAPQVALLLVLAIATGTVFAMSSANYNVIADSFQGGGSGGAVSGSAGYRMEGSFGSAIYMWDTSSSFKLCSGFACIETLYHLMLPLIQR